MYPGPVGGHPPQWSPSDGLAGISPVQSYVDYTPGSAVGEVAGPLPVVGLVSRNIRSSNSICCETLVAFKHLTHFKT